MKINVLGAEYDFLYKSPDEDDFLKGDCNGYCDPSTRTIVVTTENTDLGNFEAEQKKIARHEIIHAFMFESGLGSNWEHRESGQEETTVDWFAIQFPKMMKVFELVGCV